MSDILAAIDPTVQVAAITGFFTLIGLALDKFRRDSKKQGEKIDAIRHHVQNDHKTNLRHDIDTVMDGMNKVLEGQARHDATLASHGASIGGIRDDLRLQRKEHIALQGRVDNLIFALPN